ncbi:hypothetical protein J4Q44_G00085650 [Coregonus suidteri]|uniref:Uncharacterized protein n=1 Tax=Coregonus suidteri TaxID=861788 RepID=A0AAN8R1K1_9TELE
MNERGARERERKRQGQKDEGCLRRAVWGLDSKTTSRADSRAQDKSVFKTGQSRCMPVCEPMDGALCVSCVCRLTHSTQGHRF